MADDIILDNLKKGGSVTNIKIKGIKNVLTTSASETDAYVES